MKCDVVCCRKIGSLLLLAAVVTFFGACSSRDPRLEGLREMEGSNTPAPSPERIAELEETIAEYGQVVNSKVEAAMRQANYLKLLAQEYMRSELYGPALDTLREAIVIEPRNAVLHQLAGVCAGYLAKASARAQDREEFYAEAERYYLQSLEIDPNYVDGMYALGTLYHFELGRHLDAVEVLTRLLDRSPGHVQAMFVLARAYVSLGNIDEAVAIYDRIIETAADRNVREQARRNRLLVLGESDE
jgi:tetratricopeptide (TPR) repeat protein